MLIYGWSCSSVVNTRKSSWLVQSQLTGGVNQRQTDVRKTSSWLRLIYRWSLFWLCAMFVIGSLWTSVLHSVRHVCPVWGRWLEKTDKRVNKKWCYLLKHKLNSCCLHNSTSTYKNLKVWNFLTKYVPIVLQYTECQKNKNYCGQWKWSSQSRKTLLSRYRLKVESTVTRIMVAHFFK